MHPLMHAGVVWLLVVVVCDSSRCMLRPFPGSGCRTGWVLAFGQQIEQALPACLHVASHNTAGNQLTIDMFAPVLES